MITTLTGENDVLRQAALGQMVASFVAAYTDMGLERLDGEAVSYEQMLGSVQSLPFLASRKLVVLRRPSACKEFTEKFEKLLEEVAETNDVVLVEPKLDKRLAYYKQLKKLTDFREFAVLDANGLARYLMNYAKEQGGSLSSNDARLLIDRIGTNQLMAQHEVDKLLAYDPQITKQAIELLTESTPQSSIFELLQTAFAGDTGRAMALYKAQRAARVEPQQILAMLVWQLHILAIVKTAGGKTADTIARDAKLNPFTVSKSQNLARTISLQQLKRLVRELRQFDVRLKSEALNADETMQYYLMNLAN